MAQASLQRERRSEPDKQSEIQQGQTLVCGGKQKRTVLLTSCGMKNYRKQHISFTEGTSHFGSYWLAVTTSLIIISSTSNCHHHYQCFLPQVVHQALTGVEMFNINWMQNNTK